MSEAQHPYDLLQEVKADIARNLPQACWELCQWRSSGILQDGVIRDAGERLHAIDPHGHIRLAEGLTIDLALHRLSMNYALTSQAEADDFPLGKACDLSKEGGCESCQ